MHSADHSRVRELLGREPQGDYAVVVRDASGDPVVLRNDPILRDGTPMPTRYWLIGPSVVVAISRLESTGGVRRAEAEIDPDLVADAHRRYAAERDAAMPPGHTGPAPSGGVAGTAHGREVPPRPLRMAPRRRRRPGGRLGGAPPRRPDRAR